MQTSFMHPPFGFALFYLRSVAPAKEYLDKLTGKLTAPVTTGQIYWGAVPFVLIQVIMVGAGHRVPADGHGRYKATKATVDTEQDPDRDSRAIDAGRTPGGASDQEERQKRAREGRRSATATRRRRRRREDAPQARSEDAAARRRRNRRVERAARGRREKTAPARGGRSARRAVRTAQRYFFACDMLLRRDHEVVEAVLGDAEPERSGRCGTSSTARRSS